MNVVGVVPEFEINGGTLVSSVPPGGIVTTPLSGTKEGTPLMVIALPAGRLTSREFVVLGFVSGSSGNISEPPAGMLTFPLSGTVDVTPLIVIRVPAGKLTSSGLVRLGLVIACPGDDGCEGIVSVPPAGILIFPVVGTEDVIPLIVMIVPGGKLSPKGSVLLGLVKVCPLNRVCVSPGLSTTVVGCGSIVDCPRFGGVVMTMNSGIEDADTTSPPFGNVRTLFGGIVTLCPDSMIWLVVVPLGPGTVKTAPPIAINGPEAESPVLKADPGVNAIAELGSSVSSVVTVPEPPVGVERVAVVLGESKVAVEFGSSGSEPPGGTVVVSVVPFVVVVQV